jgi:hypothetical protein
MNARRKAYFLLACAAIWIVLVMSCYVVGYFAHELYHEIQNIFNPPPTPPPW